MDQALRWSLASCSPAVAHLWSPTALAYSAEVASATKAGRPWHLSTRFVGRNPLKRTLLAYSAEAVASAAKAGRQGYGGYPPRIHPRVNTRGFLRSRVKKDGRSLMGLASITCRTSGHPT